MHRLVENLRMPFVIVAVGALLIAPERPALAQQPAMVVSTKAGQLRGLRDSAKGVSVFRGVHYEQPTGGARRFKPPLPVAPWAASSRRSR